MVKKVKKRVRREYTKEDFKELRAHSKENSRCKNHKAYKAHGRFAAPEGRNPRDLTRSSAIIRMSEPKKSSIL